MRALLLVLAVVAAAGCGQADARARLDRALARTAELRTVSFELRGAVRADGADAPPVGGPVQQEVAARGSIAFPDRLHLIADLDGLERELLIVGRRTWTRSGDEWRPSGSARRTAANDPLALLAIIEGPGTASFAGYGFEGGTLTYHVRIDLDAAGLRERLERRGDFIGGLGGAGRIDVAIGVFDDRIRRQRVEIVETSGDQFGFGSGVYRVRTRYVVDYSRFDEPVEIAEPP